MKKYDLFEKCAALDFITWTFILALVNVKDLHVGNISKYHDREWQSPSSHDYFELR